MNDKRKRAYDITNPYGWGGREIRVFADPEVLEVLRGMDWLTLVTIHAARWAIADLSPLYDIDEAWLLTVAALDEYCSRQITELDPDVWMF